MKSSMFEKFREFQISKDEILKVQGAGTTCTPCGGVTPGCRFCQFCEYIAGDLMCTYWNDCTCTGSGGGGPCTDPFGCPEK